MLKLVLLAQLRLKNSSYPAYIGLFIDATELDSSKTSSTNYVKTGLYGEISLTGSNDLYIKQKGENSGYSAYLKSTKIYIGF